MEKFLKFPLVRLCLVSCILLVLTSCSSQNPVVNPSPGRWVIVHSENPGQAENGRLAIAATSINDAWAVGNYSNQHLVTQGGNALIEHWNGSAWSAVKSPQTPLESSILNGVAAISPTDAWAVGYSFSTSNSNEQQTLIEHWNGTAWTIVKSPNPAPGSDLFAITALSATDIWAVGVYSHRLGTSLVSRTLIEHWNGTAWTVVQSQNPGSGFNYLTGIAALSADDIWAVGFSSSGQTVQGMQEVLIEHWDGTSWKVVQGQSPGTNGNVLSEVTAISANDVWAVGSTSGSAPETDTLIEHWNGSSWSTVQGQNPGKQSNNLTAIVARSPHDIWAVGDYNSVLSAQDAQPLIEHWNGSSWSTVISPNIGTHNTSLGGVTLVPHSSHLWAVGSGATFSTVSVSSPDATQPTSVMSVTAQTLVEACCS